MCANLHHGQIAILMALTVYLTIYTNEISMNFQQIDNSTHITQFTNMAYSNDMDNISQKDSLLAL